MISMAVKKVSKKTRNKIEEPVSNYSFNTGG